MGKKLQHLTFKESHNQYWTDLFSRLQLRTAVGARGTDAGKGRLFFLFFFFHTAAELLPLLRRGTPQGGGSAVLLFDSLFDGGAQSLCIVAQVVRRHLLCRRVMWQEMRSQGGALTEPGHLNRIFFLEEAYLRLSSSQHFFFLSETHCCKCTS